MYFKTDKNKNYIKNCETIIKQNGSCDGFSCEDCCDKHRVEINGKFYR